MVDEEIRQRRELKMDVGDSSFVPGSRERSTSDGAEADVGTTEVGPSDDLLGSGKSDRPAS